MMKWTTTVLMAVAALGFAAASVSADDAKAGGDLKKMQGAWVNDGGDGPDVKWTVKDETVEVEVNGEVYKCKMVLNEKAEPHKTADLTINEGPGDSAGKSSKAIYKFEDDKLIMCVTHPGSESRPSKFETVEGECFVFPLKKDKD